MNLYIEISEEQILFKYKNTITKYEKGKDYLETIESYIKKCGSIFFNPNIILITHYKLNMIEKSYYQYYFDSIGYNKLSFITIIDILDKNDRILIFDKNNCIDIYYSKELLFKICTKNNRKNNIINILRNTRVSNNAIYITNKVKVDYIKEIENKTKVIINYLKVDDEYYISKAQY